MQAKRTGIRLKQYRGEWRVVDTYLFTEKDELWLIERYNYADGESYVPPMIVSYKAEKIIVENAANGWADLPNTFGILVKLSYYLPLESAVGGTPLIYIMREGGTFCATCAAEHADEIDTWALFYEGLPHKCDNGCGTLIESAYGDPDKYSGQRE